MKTNIRKKLLEWCPQPKTSAPTSLTRLSQLRKRSKLLYAIPVTLLAAVIVGLFIFMSTYIGPGQVKIDVMTDKPYYLPGERVQIYIYVKNPQIWRVQYPPTMTYQIEQNGTYIQPLLNTHSNYGENVVPALSRALYYTYVWDQGTGFASNRTQVPSGNYTFRPTLGGIQLAPMLKGTHTSYDDSYDPFSSENGGSCTIEIRPAP